MLSQTLSRDIAKIDDNIPNVDAPKPGEATRRIAGTTRQSEKIRKITTYTPLDLVIIG